MQGAGGDLNKRGLGSGSLRLGGCGGRGCSIDILLQEAKLYGLHTKWGANQGVRKG